MYYSAKEIENAFFILDIPIIPDSQKIIYAWKKKASLYHPDKTISPEKKIEYHNKFIELLKARDICLEAAKQSLNNFYDWQTTKETHDINSKTDVNLQNDISVEEEWESFVRDSKGYFSKNEFLLIIIISFFKIFFHSISLSILSSICGLSIGILFLGILSKAPEFPFFFWISLPISLIFLIFNLYRYLQFLDSFTLKLLIKIGYPFKYFILTWIIENLFFLILFYFEYKYSLYIFLLGNLGFIIQYQRIHSKILKVEEILIKNSETGIII